MSVAAIMAAILGQPAEGAVPVSWPCNSAFRISNDLLEIEPG